MWLDSFGNFGAGEEEADGETEQKQGMEGKTGCSILSRSPCEHKELVSKDECLLL